MVSTSLEVGNIATHHAAARNVHSVPGNKWTCEVILKNLMSINIAAYRHRTALDH